MREDDQLARRGASRRSGSSARHPIRRRWHRWVNQAAIVGRWGDPPRRCAGPCCLFRPFRGAAVFDTDSRTDARWLAAAVDLAVRNVAEGGGPFGAVVVADGELLAAGAEPGDPRQRPDRARRGGGDPARPARPVGDFSLAGATLYASCEPCPLCMAAALWARVDRVVYAADRHDAARGGFDDLSLLRAVRAATGPPGTPGGGGARCPGAAAPFDAWLAHADRVAY